MARPAKYEEKEVKLLDSKTTSFLGEEAPVVQPGAPPGAGLDPGTSASLGPEEPRGSVAAASITRCWRTVGASMAELCGSAALAEGLKDPR